MMKSGAIFKKAVSTVPPFAWLRSFAASVRWTITCKYSITSMARTRMARLPWMIRTFFHSLQSPPNSSRKQIFRDFFLFYHEIVCCVYSLLIEAILMSTLNIQSLCRNRKDFLKLSQFASWTGAMINPQWLELSMSRTNFQGPKDVRAIEVRLYYYIDFSDLLTPYVIHIYMFSINILRFCIYITI